MRYWLLKSEPASFGIDDLAATPAKQTSWDGVRNYQARNFMRDEMRKGDLAFFYHSSCDPTGIAGIVRIVKEAHPDLTAFDRQDPHYDPGSDPQNPRWFMVDVELERKFRRVITLDELKRHQKDRLKDLVILRRGNRLSITPVTKSEWSFIVSLEAAQRGREQSSA